MKALSGEDKEKGKEKGKEGVIHRLRRLDADYLRGNLRGRRRGIKASSGEDKEKGKESHPQIAQISADYLRGFKRRNSHGWTG